MKFKKLLSRIAAPALALLLTHAPIARADDVSAFANVSVKNKYVSGSGFNILDGPVMQGCYGFTVKNLTLDSWNNYDLENREMTENDIEASIRFDNAKIYAGHYTSPNSDFHDVQSASLTLYPKTIGNPSIEFAQSFGKGSGHGQAITLSASHSVNLGNNTSLNLDGKVGWNNNYFTQYQGFSHVQEGIELSHTTHNGVSIASGVRFQQPLEDKFDGAIDNETIFSLTIGKTFGGK